MIVLKNNFLFIFIVEKNQISIEEYRILINKRQISQKVESKLKSKTWDFT